jgi:DNA-binding Xre family transcriptional regulator
MIRLRVKEVANARQMSQGKLARRADIDIKTLQKIYRNPTSIVTTETLAKLAEALGVSSEPRSIRAVMLAWVATEAKPYSAVQLALVRLALV